MGNHISNNMVIIGGCARVPQDNIIYHRYGGFMVAIEVSLKNFKIIDFDCTWILNNCPVKKHMKRLLLGQDIIEGIDNTVKLLNEKVILNEKEFIITAFEDVKTKYLKFKEKTLLHLLLIINCMYALFGDSLQIQ